MEGLQLLLEGKLYGLSEEKLVTVMQYLKMENAGVLGGAKSKRKTMQMIQKK